MDINLSVFRRMSMSKDKGTVPPVSGDKGPPPPPKDASAQVLVPPKPKQVNLEETMKR